MRTKDEILKLGQITGEEAIYDRLNIGGRDLLILEVLIDIRDVLQEKSDNILKSAQIDHETMRLMHDKAGKEAQDENKS